MFERFSRPPKQSPVGSYKMEVISVPEECDWDKYLPLEFRFIFSNHPEYKEKFRNILQNGKAIGIRTVLRTPENILKAVHTISVHSQHNYILNWLPKLLKDKHLPVFTEQDITKAKNHNEDLHEAMNIILKDRLRFKKIVLIDEENLGINPDEQRFATELSEIIYPIAVDYSVFRVIIDNAQERTKIAQSIIKALLIIGPVAHFLEKFISGLGKFFAASADDLLGESAELMALRGSGFTWRELAKRGKILIPVFILATWGAFSVEGLIQSNRLILGGAVFGLSAVALSLTTAIQSIFMYKANADKLLKEGKTKLSTTKELYKISFLQDFTNPARLGLIIGALMAPIMGIIGSLLGVMHNGWVLASIGSTESIVAGITVVSASYFNEWRFRNKVKKMIFK